MTRQGTPGASSADASSDSSPHDGDSAQGGRGPSRDDLLAQIERLTEQLRQSKRLEGIGRLAGGISHDFNNILTVIQGYASLLQQRRPSPELQAILGAVNNATLLTRELIAFGRDAHQRPDHVADLNAIVLRTAKFIARILGEDIEVESELTDDLWGIHADVIQIQQVLLSLAVHARDSMPHGGRLCISTHNVVLDANDLPRSSVAVPGEFARIFIRAVSAKGPEAAASRSSAEQPLDMSTALEIIRDSRGLLEVRAEPEGNCYTIDLPRSSMLERTESVSTPTLGPKGGDEVVLFVEDDPTICELMSQVLRDARYTVYTALRPTEAKEIWERHGDRVSILITDIVMPEMSGRELVEQLRVSRPDLPFLLITGYDPGNPNREPQSDAPCLRKPFTPTELLVRLRQVLEA